MPVRTLALVGVAVTALGACSQKPSAQGATAASPSAAPQTGRVRGTLQEVTPTLLTVQTYDGRRVATPIDAKTGFAWVVKSSLSDVKNGDFIGTATSGPDNALRAVEVVIFPASMRGTGKATTLGTFPA